MEHKNVLIYKIIMYGTWYRSLRTKVWGRWLSTRTPHLSVRSQLLMKNDASFSALICSACAGKKQAARSQSKFTRCLRDEKTRQFAATLEPQYVFFSLSLNSQCPFQFLLQTNHVPLLSVDFVMSNSKSERQASLASCEINNLVFRRSESTISWCPPLGTTVGGKGGARWTRPPY